jgi:pimeloyl-ACP methyl ester carboxylesterase
MAPVARELARRRGVLEPPQTACTVQGQVEELRTILEEHANLPVTLAGYSWGAWLGFLAAAYYPTLVEKLILISSGPFEERYVAGMLETRLGRLSRAERAEFAAASKRLGDPQAADTDRLLARLGALASKADSYDPLSGESPVLDLRPDIYEAVWPEASELRRSGKLLALGSQIRCPVVAIHGDHDPHPAQGVKEPLSRVLADFDFVLLPQCGHKPWAERQARDEFFRVLDGHLP